LHHKNLSQPKKQSLAPALPFKKPTEKYLHGRHPLYYSKRLRFFLQAENTNNLSTNNSMPQPSNFKGKSLYFG
jgi:hypothetical protein